MNKKVILTLILSSLMKEAMDAQSQKNVTTDVQESLKKEVDHYFRVINFYKEQGKDTSDLKNSLLKFMEGLKEHITLKQDLNLLEVMLSTKQISKKALLMIIDNLNTSDNKQEMENGLNEKQLKLLKLTKRRKSYVYNINRLQNELEELDQEIEMLQDELNSNPKKADIEIDMESVLKSIFNGK